MTPKLDDEPTTSERGELRQAVLFLRDSARDLAPCGRSVASLLDRISRRLLNDDDNDNGEATDGDDAKVLSASLIKLANEKLNSYDYRAVPVHWRRLFTDATLLNALARLLSGTSDDESDLLDLVRNLDMALIVAGAPGMERTELVFRLVAAAQARLAMTTTTTTTTTTADAARDRGRPAKRRRLSGGERLPPPYLARPLPVLPTLPDFVLPNAQREHSRPFVVRAAASEWTAVERWKDVEYLRAIGGGRGRVVPVEVGHDYTKAGWGQRIVPWYDFLDSTFARATSTEEDVRDRERFYLAQHSLLNQFPLLARDFPIPSLVYSEPPALVDQLSEYVAPQNEEGWILNAWLGGGGTVSQAHTDPYWNCYIQVVGSKWIWVAPPSASRHMSTFGSRRPDDDDTDEPATTDYMTNTSTIDVTAPLPNSSTLANVDPPRESPPSTYTRAWLEQVEPVAQQIVLEAGDILVMPPGWWHAMKSLETSFSISMVLS